MTSAAWRKVRVVGGGYGGIPGCLLYSKKCEGRGAGEGSLGGAERGVTRYCSAIQERGLYT